MRWPKSGDVHILRALSNVMPNDRTPARGGQWSCDATFTCLRIGSIIALRLQLIGGTTHIDDRGGTVEGGKVAKRDALFVDFVDCFVDRPVIIAPRLSSSS